MPNPKSSNLVRNQVYLYSEQLQRIRVIALQERRPVAKVIRKLIDRGLEQEPPADAYTALMGLAEIGERYGYQGPHDLSENHDAYLYGDKEDHQR